MANHALPVLATPYDQWTTLIRDRIDDAIRMLDSSSPAATNLPANAKRWNATSSKWEKWSGTAWSDLATTYSIAISGNAGTATKLATARAINGVNFDGSAAITIKASTTAALTFATSGGAAAGTTFDGGTARTISFSSVGAAGADGTGASGTWSIDISGNAGTVTDGVYGSAANSFTGANSFRAGANFTLEDPTTPTKKVQFAVSSVTAATTRTLTIPNADGTIALTNVTQTISGTNTFTAASNTFGNSTATGTTTLASGATVSGSTKTVNIGTGGVAGSTTNINISTANGGTVTINGVIKAFDLRMTRRDTTTNGGSIAFERYDGTLHWDLEVFGTSATNQVFRLYNLISNAVSLTVDHTHNMVVTGDITAFSDERVKTDWKALPKGLLAQLAQVKRGTYTRSDTGQRQVGLSAQGMRELLPEFVRSDEKGMLSLAYGQAALVLLAELVAELEQRGLLEVQ